MQEFSSISVSSYDAASLAEQLTEKSAAGWDVVAIVPAGTNVVAYLSRAASAAAAAVDTASGDTVSLSDAATSAPAFTLGADTAAETTEEAERDLAAHPAEPAPAEPEEPEPSPVEEPAGWAVAPEPSEPTLPETHETTWSPTLPTGATEATTYGEAAEPAPQPEPEPQPRPEPEPAAAAAAPAGWYADPANRYELRYWDGSQWTEHVSRGGQQFTDPPVA